MLLNQICIIFPADFDNNLSFCDCWTAEMVWQKIRQFLRNPYFARTSHDRAAFTMLVVGAQLALWYETCHVMQYYHADDTEASATSISHVVFALFLYASALANIYKMIRTRIVCDLTALGVSEEADWPYCGRCLCHRPPRTHHCPVCDVCVLKRDHHCWFGGVCVGHGNHRYYVCAISYMLVAAVYGNFYHFCFMVHQLEHLGHFGIPVCIAIPHFCAVFGYLSFYQFLVAVLSFIGFFLLAMLFWLLWIQVVQITRGQTSYERKHGEHTYDNSVLENIRAVFGTRWYVAWICPWISSPLTENGAVFRISELKTK